MSPASHPITLAVPPQPTDHAQGSDHARVVVVEYGDFECPSCKVAATTPALLMERFPNQVRFVFRHFPLEEAHPHSLLAAEASEAAGAQGKFWEMHDALFEQQSDLGSDLVHKLARRLRLDIPRFEADLEARRYRPRVKRDFMGAMRSGVAATPTFFINGERYDGILEQRALLAALLRVADAP